MTDEIYSGSNHFDEQPNPVDYTPCEIHSQGVIYSSNDAIINHEDPLIHAAQYQFEPIHLHHVDPHYVPGYFREDGTYVKGYFRSGDGTGYVRSNPDDTTINNLNQD